ncbi:MAG: glutathione S-transferase N-terminal domain-containing protein [Myxococcota bacterium]
MSVRAIDVGTSWTASVLRLGLGLAATHAGKRPAKTLELYEFEGCPFCRKVREALTMLDLEAKILPCPKGGPNFRPEVVRRGGKALFPYLVDPNSDTEMYESSAIVRYLYERYGDRKAPLWLSTDITVPLGSIASLIRMGRGVRYRPARAPEAPLEMFGFEASPYVRIARETLCELEIPYLLRPVGKRSGGRGAFVERSGKMMVPWLSDPNTEVEMFESADIRTYLLDTYAR